jgi:hypothetical protein
VRVLLFILLILFLGVQFGCQQDPPPPDPEAPKPIWRIDYSWSYDSGNPPRFNDLFQPGGPYPRDTWGAILNDGTNYDLRISPQRLLPHDPSLDWDNAASFATFFESFYAGISVGTLDRNCYVLGIFEPMNTPADVYGLTFPRGTIPVSNEDHKFAASVVLSTNIRSIAILTPAEQWRMVEYCVLHELGHARGLNAVTPAYPIHGDYDHFTHSGSNQGICLMRIPVAELLPQSHAYCDRHKMVLRNCLTAIQFMYAPTDPCAQ